MDPLWTLLLRACFILHFLVLLVRSVSFNAGDTFICSVTDLGTASSSDNPGSHRACTFYLGLAEPSTVPALDASCIAHTFFYALRTVWFILHFSCCWSVTSDLSDIFTDSAIDIGTASVSFTPG